MPVSSSVPAEEEGWQVVSSEWWRIPFNAVSWAYSPQDSAANKVTQSPRVAKPPHYPADLLHIRPASADDLHDEDLLEGDDGQLNPDLVGCVGALAALESYEIDVGFCWLPPQLEQQARPDLSVAVDAHHVALGKDRWDEQVQDLLGGLSIGSTDQSDDDSLSDIHRSTSSIDLTDSDRSVLSLPMPATPRARRSYANIVVKRASPSRSTSSRDSDRSPQRLNAAASSFVPSPSKPKPVSDPAPFLSPLESVPFPLLTEDRTPTPPSPTFNRTFVFPSLDVPPVPAVKITKDAQGFYSEVESTVPAPSHARTSSTLLPAFLHDTFTRRRPPASKTRAMVDRLKSSASGVPQEPAKTQPPRLQLELSALAKPRLSVSEYGGDEDTPPIDDDSEGWIGGDDSVPAKVSSKTRRTRDLFLALTRRRSNSSPPKTTVIVDPPADNAIGITVELPSPASSSSDGWIEGPALLLPESNKPKPGVVHLPSRKATPVENPKPAVPHPHPQRTPKRSKRSNPPPQAPAPALGPGPGPALYVHPPPYYYPHAHPHAVPAQYAAAYMHQMQVLQQQQQHMQHMRRVSAPLVPMPIPSRTPRGSMSSTGSGEWFPYPYPVPVPVAYPVPVPLHGHAPVFVPRGV
ncbi:hypothetical protein DFH07DRAFT_550235 [Mycena maculata]|uniref:Uncharacterized protein n=1 Tax=Mycena maculata TaxID=230809 RepID=A0AAD7N7I0_9AGAR|nr:hypothetical protein DFH07DRAFT_550235 [Mycena maculata]